MNKKILYIAFMLLAGLGFQACDDDFERPPMVMPEQTGDGGWSSPYNVGAALLKIYSGDYRTGEKVFVEGIISQIESSQFDPSYGNITYYISDNGEEGNELEIYRGLGLNGERFTSASDLKVGDKVVVCCQLTLYGSIAETTQGAILASLNGSHFEGVDPAEAEGTGVKDDPFNVAAALDSLYAGTMPVKTKVYVKGVVSNISDLSTSYGNATYFISDTISLTGFALEELEIYRGYGLGGNKFASTDDLKIGDHVIVYGEVVLFNSTPEFTTGSIIVYRNGTWNEGSSGGGSTPDTGNAIYSGLSANADGWTIDNVTLPEGLSYVWKWDDSYKCLKASAFANSTNYATDAYILTSVDLSGYKSASAAFDQTYKYGADIENSLSFVVREQGASEWQKLTIPQWPTGQDWTFVNSGAIDLSAYAGKKIEVAFRYVSTSSAAATWEIKNFVVSGTK